LTLRDSHRVIRTWTTRLFISKRRSRFLTRLQKAAGSEWHDTFFMLVYAVIAGMKADADLSATLSELDNEMCGYSWVM
jgi:hypothetical protein